MTNPWLALPARNLIPGTRSLVSASWDRARARNLDPERDLPPLILDAQALREYRAAHPLAAALPVIRKLLLRDAEGDSGVLIAVGDEAGRLLWVDGDRRLKSGAERMLFVEGADWSENGIGTSAPGTALALDHAVQIHRAEHFAQAVHAWSCTAVPVHDPETRRIIGVIDITGGDEVVDPHTLPLVEATALAVESEIMVQRLRESLAGRPASPRRPLVEFMRGPRRPSRAAAPTLNLLGRDTGELDLGPEAPELPVGAARGTDPREGFGPAAAQGAPEALSLSARHTEILALLAWHPAGLSAEDLAWRVYGEPTVVTLRAEIVRLRKILARRAPALVIESRPYRLPSPPEVDGCRVLSLLDRGAHRVALASYPGPLLPRSEAPGIVDMRTRLASRMREALLTDASVDVLLQYAQTPDAYYDVEVWTACLHLLPARSPRRARVVEHLEELETQLA
ncbi:helix-turn-helix domain-containing protein [Mycetocola spongiae]|uniref:helix-turn-helix domain-containing protein n=1 Tax=Mycetocola spongiae TaxID=2859226 RepID=UPI001CF4371F|nr:helix-turn-helix domain-containing protein [Mycetocola spongiae]UCR89371.1 GAF domain-containing protein [Mycetocola spongiae]